MFREETDEEVGVWRIIVMCLLTNSKLCSSTSQLKNSNNPGNNGVELSLPFPGLTAAYILFLLLDLLITGHLHTLPLVADFVLPHPPCHISPTQAGDPSGLQQPTG